MYAIARLIGRPNELGNGPTHQPGARPVPGTASCTELCCTDRPGWAAEPGIAVAPTPATTCRPAPLGATHLPEGSAGSRYILRSRPGNLSITRIS